MTNEDSWGYTKIMWFRKDFIYTNEEVTVILNYFFKKDKKIKYEDIKKL